MSQQSICVYAALAINSFACSEPEGRGMEDTTPLLGMNYSNFDQKLAKKQAKREEHNVESAKDYSQMEDVGSLAEEAKEKDTICSPDKETELKRENSNNCWRMTIKVPFSEVILFSSYYYTYMHRAPATVTSLVYGLALVTLPLVPN